MKTYDITDEQVAVFDDIDAGRDFFTSARISASAPKCGAFGGSARC